MKEEINVKKEKNDIHKKFDVIMDVSTELKVPHKSRGDEDILISFNSNTMKKDLLIFKDELLKDLKRLQTKLYEKAEDNEIYTKEKIEEFNLQIKKYSEKVMSLSNSIITDKAIRENVESLIEYKNKNQEIVMTNGIQLDNLEKEFYNNIYRIDNILKESVIYPGIIGNITKFKTFHDFIDYILNECSLNISFREKTSLDINNLRNNDEKIIFNLTNKLEKAKKALSLYTDTCIKKIENKINNLNDALNDRINNYRIESMTYSENMKKASESLLKQVNSIIQTKNDIFNKFDEKMNIINKEHSRIIKYFTGYKNEFNEMRRAFKEMMDAINTKDFSGMNRKINKLKTRRSFMINNNDFQAFENKLKNINNVIHPISMNDMFMSSTKISRLSVKFDNLSNEKEKDKNSYDKFLKEFKRIGTENKRLSKIIEQKDFLIDKKIKNEDLKIEENPKKLHKKKNKIKNDIYLEFNNQNNNIKLVEKKKNKYNSVCAPNKILKTNILNQILGIFGNNDNKKYSLKKSPKDPIYNTSISKSEKSLISLSSKPSEENRMNNIKTKYKTNLILSERNESKKAINKDNNKLNIIKKEYQEDIDSKSDKNSGTKINYFENKIYNSNLTQKKIKKENKIEKKIEDYNYIENNKKSAQQNLLKNIYITIDGSNQLEINPSSLLNDGNKKDIVNSVKSLMSNKMSKTLSGYPKIVTNKGERIIVSSRPVYQKQKFNLYTNPNILALNYNIHDLYENNNKKQNNIFQNKQLLMRMKKSINGNKSENKKISFNNNLYLSQK